MDGDSQLPAATATAQAHQARAGEAALDWWSLVHVGAGLALGAARVPLGAAAALVVGFEVVEAGLRRLSGSDGKGLFEYESWPNIAADIVLGLAGAAVGWLLFWRRSPRL